MRTNYQFGVLRAPEGDGAGGGGDAGAGDSHEAAAAKTFGSGDGGKPAASAAPAGGAGEGGKPADDQSKGVDPAASKGSIFGKIKTKAGAAPAAGEPKPGEKKPDGAGEADLPENKIVIGDKASDDTKKHFETIKGITKSLRTDLASREARIKELEGKVNGGTALPADYEKLKAEHKAFSDRIAVVDLQSHPDFIRQFTEPKAKIVQTLGTVLSDNKVEGGDLTMLLAKPRAEYMKAASEIAEKLPEYERFEFLTGARQLYQVAQSEREALGKSSELMKGFQAKTAESQRTAFSKTWEKLGGLGEFVMKLEVDDTTSPEDKAAIEAYNKGVDEVRGSAERLAFQPGGEEGVAQTAVKAATFDFMIQHAIPRMEAEYTQLTTLVSKLQNELKELRGGKGEAGSGGGGGGDGGGKEVMSHEAAAKKVWG